MWVRNSGTAWLAGFAQGLSWTFSQSIGQNCSNLKAWYVTHMTGRLILLHVGIPTVLLECSQDIGSGFPQSSWCKRPSQKLECFPWPGLGCQTPSLLLFLSVSSLSPDSVCKGTIQRLGYQEVGTIVDYLGGWFSQLGRKAKNHRKVL